ncbi:hypothetical protein [Arthrobacter sp. GAS37]|uniref:hypothetical protein n=1 Tax=Arthrobacter sp. GAS37 TaxID=3156261 RepID=UPI00384F400E
MVGSPLGEAQRIGFIADLAATALCPAPTTHPEVASCADRVAKTLQTEAIKHLVTG